MRLALLSILLGGLAASAAAQPASLDEARRAFDGRSAHVTLADGSAWRAAALRITADETSWLDDGAVVRVPTCAVAGLRIVEAPRRWPVRGAAAMGGAGVVAGALGGGALCGIGGQAEATCIVGTALAMGAAGALVGFGLDLATRPRDVRPARLVLTPTCDASACHVSGSDAR